MEIKKDIFICEIYIEASNLPDSFVRIINPVSSFSVDSYSTVSPQLTLTLEEKAVKSKL